MEVIKEQKNFLVHLDRGIMARCHIMDEDDENMRDKLQDKIITGDFVNHEIKATVSLNRSFLLRLLASMELEDYITFHVGKQNEPVLLTGEDNFCFIMPVDSVTSTLSVQDVKDFIG